MANRKASWDRRAIMQFNNAILYIAESSVLNAEKVSAEMLSQLESLPANPEKHPPDKYKLDNDGNYRAFESNRLQIAYYVGVDVIRILRVRHTSRDPQEY